MPIKEWIAEFRLMTRGVFALLWKKVRIRPLLDADLDFECSRNPHFAQQSREKQLNDYKPVFVERLRALRKGLVASFIFLISAVVVAFLLTKLGCRLSARDKVWLGGASIFSFAWSTLARLTARSFGEDTVLERLDTRIFWFLYWVGMLLGTLALI
jgi:hypothetical protein